MSMFRIFTVVIILAICVGCKSISAPGTYSGEYFYNFEFSSLFPDTNKDERWCVQGDMSEAELPAKDSQGPWGFTHVIVKGELGPVGNYGNLGACKRVLTVTELVSFSHMRRANEAAP